MTHDTPPDVDAKREPACVAALKREPRGKTCVDRRILEDAMRTCRAAHAGELDAGELVDELRKIAALADDVDELDVDQARERIRTLVGRARKAIGDEDDNADTLVSAPRVDR
jgi:hypothetical protein